MKQFDRMFAIICTFSALSGCGETPAAQPVDHAAPELPSPKNSALPKAVKIDNAGRWSLVSAPPLDPASIAAKDAMKPVVTGDRLRLFYEPLPTADKIAVKHGGTMPQNLILRSFTSRLIIMNGCLRLDMPGRPLARFNAPPLIQIDPEAYLVLGGHRADGKAEYSRIGEEVIWFGGPFETGPEQGSLPATVTDPKAIAPIHAACGSGKGVSLPATVQSMALFLARQSDSEVKKFQEM